MGASKNSTTKPLTRYFTPHSVDFKYFLEKFSKILAKNSQFKNFFSANKKKCRSRKIYGPAIFWNG